ncbi:formylmethanofuran dehydrogenase subunit A [Candidatus Nitrosacidococcus sp. I8]|uniref:formylmethanofuran dehydrogenase subunit A n=1 Tax=Candidatus Nitrosacidococcus sp. I8 TaxID=2942908 RepID=UPI0022278B3B|nr:formylmethanofuran dehydrogenase subunit A [Candidatus Nitrosacidococcus sp. I8]CAH9013997.1 Formyltransferase/hydrolase complex Fhc subunit A [Candidatus Nitrosacidococcus sp. I8]
MIIKLTGGVIYDPTHQIEGKIGNIYIQNGQIAAPPRDNHFDLEYDVVDKIIMPGAIDIHSHIGGGSLNLARMLFPKKIDNRSFSSVLPNTFDIGYEYAKMGYTAAFEPAISPINARQAHLEMGDIPMIDKGGYALLGNDDYLLQSIAKHTDQELINHYVAWVLSASYCLGIKVVNPGGVNAFKFNQRKLDLDEVGPFYGITPRQILLHLAQAVYDLGIPHPLHIHGCNLGVPGNLETTLKTIHACEGLPAHFAHVQFHSYSKEGNRKFSSGAAQVAEAINNHPNITVDVGQILFGQTVSVSADSMQQYAHFIHAYPKKGIWIDESCHSGCGIVPFKYQDKSFVNSLQWIIGLEIFLLINNPWQVCLTTDHPAGALFTTYPHIIRLLMDRSFRDDMLATLHPDAVKVSILKSIKREYSLYEIAIITRSGPAKLLGLTNKGHLDIKADADITIHTDHQDKERMFAQPTYVFKDGELIVKNGKLLNPALVGTTHIVRPSFDDSIEKDLQNYFDRYLSLKLSNFKMNDEEIIGDKQGHIYIHPCYK